MKKTILCGMAVALVGAGYLQATTANPQSLSPVPSHITQHRELLDRYCVTCHNVNLATADLLLDQADVEEISENAELWSKVAQKLRAGAMPPAGMPRPE